MKFGFSRLAAAACLFVCIHPAWAQQAPLSNKDAFELYGRVAQLMESVGITVPELAHAAGPLTENARQAVITMKGLNRQHGGVAYTLITNARAFLMLVDTLPKPDNFPQEAARQLAELREKTDRAEANFRAQLIAKESSLRNPDRDNLARYAEDNAKLAPPQSGRPRVVFLGDSITDGWRLNEYFSGRDFVNRGISGQVSGEMLGRLRADVIHLKPEAVLILAGTNDIARGTPLSTIENNIASMAELAELHGIKPLLATILSVSDYHKDRDPAYEMTRTRKPQMIRDFNEWLRSFCHQHNFILVDYYTPTVDASGFLRAEMADDGLHPNGAGYRVMAPVALQAIDKALAGKRRAK